MKFCQISIRLLIFMYWERRRDSILMSNSAIPLCTDNLQFKTSTNMASWDYLKFNESTNICYSHVKAGRTYINYNKNFISLKKRKLLHRFVIISKKQESSFDFRVYKDQEMLSNYKQRSYSHVVKHIKCEIPRPQNAIRPRKT